MNVRIRVALVTIFATVLVANAGATMYAAATSKTAKPAPPTVYTASTFTRTPFPPGKDDFTAVQMTLAAGTYDVRVRGEIRFALNVDAGVRSSFFCHMVPTDQGDSQLSGVVGPYESLILVFEQVMVLRSATAVSVHCAWRGGDHPRAFTIVSATAIAELVNPAK